MSMLVKSKIQEFCVKIDTSLLGSGVRVGLCFGGGVRLECMMRVVDVVVRNLKIFEDDL